MILLRNVAKAVIVDNGRLLAIAKVSHQEYYVLPGGGQEPGEPLPETVRRECLEELGLQVQVGALLFVRDYIGRNHEFAESHSGLHQVEFFFSCTVIGTPTKASNPDSRQTGTEWLDIEGLESVSLYPKAIRTLMAKDHSVPPATAYLGDVN